MSLCKSKLPPDNRIDAVVITPYKMVKRSSGTMVQSCRNASQHLAMINLMCSSPSQWAAAIGAENGTNSPFMLLFDLVELLSARRLCLACSTHVMIHVKHKVLLSSPKGMYAEHTFLVLYWALVCYSACRFLLLLFVLSPFMSGYCPQRISLWQWRREAWNLH